MQNFKKQILSLGILFFFGLIAFGSEDQKEVEKEVSNEKSVMTVSAVEIASAFENNEVAAEEKYNEKIITVTGVVSSINKDILNEITVELEIPTMTLFRCHFSDDQKELVAGLATGQQIKFKGKFEKNIYLDLKGCSFVK